eukprot:TRINITY_DN24272_c0_g1_i3.p1 TRINITY_DN24272_c0_g1~~TRINITY_DN24272_c0_g1_i3.p1  ORF type:complete len:172 (+),score=20.37 TRINITY_DN24272_c0_g1_i3:138-653(+)
MQVPQYSLNDFFEKSPRHFRDASDDMWPPPPLALQQSQPSSHAAFSPQVIVQQPVSLSVPASASPLFSVNDFFTLSPRHFGQDSGTGPPPPPLGAQTSHSVCSSQPAGIVGLVRQAPVPSFGHTLSAPPSPRSMQARPLPASQQLHLPGSSQRRAAASPMPRLPSSPAEGL